MSGSLYWIRWKKRAKNGGGWTMWHASHHGQNDTLCGMVKPFERTDFETEYDGENMYGADLCPRCQLPEGP